MDHGQIRELGNAGEMKIYFPQNNLRGFYHIAAQYNVCRWWNGLPLSGDGLVSIVSNGEGSHDAQELYEEKIIYECVS